MATKQIRITWVVFINGFLIFVWNGYRACGLMTGYLKRGETKFSVERSVFNIQIAAKNEYLLHPA
jgi:hypothetical protein